VRAVAAPIDSKLARNRAEYEQRVNRVLDHIRAHLADELSLETLAQVAAFSPFHFHRIFKAMTGENLRELIQRTRLEGAASRLRYDAGADILVVALDHGFSSASAFTRAFKERFGMTPSAWREDRNLRTADRKPCTAPDPVGALQGSSSASHAGEEDLMKVTIQNLPAYHVAYFRNLGPYGAGGNIPETWQKLSRWAQARDLWTADRLCIGIALDDPMVTEPAKCRYDACIVIPAGYQADGGVNVADVPGGKHATAEFRGSSLDIGRAWMELYGRWLPESGYQPDNTCFELYKGEAWDGKTDAFRCDLCVPVRPL
jgi:AraC family transcriptional regulator